MKENPRLRRAVIFRWKGAFSSGNIRSGTGPEGLSRHSDGGGAQRLPQRAGRSLLLHGAGEIRGADAHGKAGHFRAEGPVLP